MTLEVLGVRTGRITEVFGFEPVEITVQAVDVLYEGILNVGYL